MNPPKRRSALGWLRHGFVLVSGAAGITLTFFLVLPIIQAIGGSPTDRRDLIPVDTGQLEPPPPPPPEEQEEEEPEPEEEPPELEQDVTPLSLDQLEVAMNPGIGSGWLAGDFTIDLSNVAGKGGDVDALFSLADLDQKPRAIYRPQPVLTEAIRRKAPGTVYVIFEVDANGRVQNPKIQRSPDPVFDRAAITAVKKWKFEPGKRKGEPVRFRMRVPITFPKDI